MKFVWFHYAKTTFYVLTNLVLSCLVVACIKVKKPGWFNARNRAVLVMSGSFLLLVAGMGGLGWAIQSFDGNTPAEKVDRLIPQVLAHLGGFMIFADLIAGVFDKCSKKGS